MSISLTISLPVVLLVPRFHVLLEAAAPSAASDYMCEEALERLSVKIHGVRPEELPHDVAGRMRAWLQGMDAVTLQVRPRGDLVDWGAWTGGAGRASLCGPGCRAWTQSRCRFGQEGTWWIGQRRQAG